MVKTYFLIGTLLVIATILINSNILYGLSLYMIPLIIYSFILLLYRVSTNKLEYTGEIKSELYFIVFTTFILWISIGFLIGFGFNIMIVLHIQYIIIFIYKITQTSAIEVLRRIFLDKFIGLNSSIVRIISISIVIALFTLTFSKLMNFSLSYFPELIVLFINSLVLTVIGYFYDFKSQLVLSLLNIYLFSLSPILLNVSGAINYMLEAFIIFTQFLVIYYLNTTNNSFRQRAEFVFVNRFKRITHAVLRVSSKIVLVISIIFMISFLLGFRGLAIVSNSMNPTINRGDLVFIDINNHEITKGDIIAFTYGDKIIVHRVYKVDEKTFAVLTKGDANQNIDPWVVTDENYVGKYVFSIPLLGYPSIFLSSLFTNPVIGISLTVTLILAFLIITLMKEMV